MSFTCKYCGETYCSEHRLPENHDCDGLEEGVKKEKESVEVEEKDSSGGNDRGSDQKWFKDQDLKEEKVRQPQRNSLFDDVVQSVLGSTTLSIIIITVVFYFIQNLVPGASEFMVLDPEVSSILSQPWTLFTVMLVHGSPFHLFANMVTFYFFGSAVEKVMSRGEMLKLYLGAGLVASLAFVVFRNLLYIMHGASVGGMTTLGPAVGASGAVVAFVGLVGVLYPKAEVLLYFFIPMKLQTAVKAFVGLEVFNLVAKTAGVTLPFIGMFASSAHLAGLAVGIWYGRKVRKRISRSAVFSPFDY